MRKSIIQQYFLPSILISTFVFIPFILDPKILLERNNDLTEFFWPIFYFIKQNILSNHTIPLINEVFFAGTPLISDPQNPIWYIPNIIFLFLDTNSAIFLSIFLHTVFCSIGVIVLTHIFLKWNKLTSYSIAIIYIFSSQYFSFLEAGHWGLIIVWSWIPYFIISVFKIFEKITLKSVLLFSISASSIYFGHILTFVICYSFLILFLAFNKKFKALIIVSLTTLIFISPALVSQLKWQGETTRNLLLNFPETFPVWRGKKEFIKSLILFNPLTEKAITIGFVSLILALVGFIKLSLRPKIIVVLIFILLGFVLMNNVSPIYDLLLKLDLFVLMRVSTRVWFVVYILLLYLIGTALEKINQNIAYLFAVLMIFESMSNSYLYFKKPINTRDNIPMTIYETINKDKTNYRTLCITRCIPQKEAAKRNIKLVEGYGTLQSLDYYYKLQDALNEKWNTYSLVLPPFDLYYKNVQPNAKKLLSFNTKYIISKNLIHSKDFSLIKRSGDYYLYKNILWKQ